MIANKTIIIAHNWTEATICQQSKQLALELSKNNKVVFLDAKRGVGNGKQLNANLIIYEWPGKRPTGWKDFRFCWKLHRRYKPDINISHFAANNIMLFVSWVFGIKYRLAYYHTTVEQFISDTGGLGFKQQLNIKIKSFFFKKATHLICPSSYSAKSASKDYGVNADKVFIVHNAIQDKGIRNLHNKSLNVGFLGRFNKSKGLDVLLKAFMKLLVINPNARLLIGGAGTEEIELRQVVEKAGAQQSFVWLGRLNYDQIFDLLQSVNCLVTPSRIDNLPTVVLEAFSCGTPVIASNTGGIPDMVKHEYNGLLFENENVDQLASCLQIVLQDPAKREKMSEAALQTFQEKFVVDKYVERLFTITGIK